MGGRLAGGLGPLRVLAVHGHFLAVNHKRPVACHLLKAGRKLPAMHALVLFESRRKVSAALGESGRQTASLRRRATGLALAVPVTAARTSVGCLVRSLISAPLAVALLSMGSRPAFLICICRLGRALRLASAPAMALVSLGSGSVRLIRTCRWILALRLAMILAMALMPLSSGSVRLIRTCRWVLALPLALILAVALLSLNGRSVFLTRAGGLVRPRSLGFLAVAVGILGKRRSRKPDDAQNQKRRHDECIYFLHFILRLP